MDKDLQAIKAHFLKSIREGVWYCSHDKRHYAFLDVEYPSNIKTSSEVSEFNSYVAKVVNISSTGQPLPTPLFEPYTIINREGKLFFNLLGFELELANLFGVISQYIIKDGFGRELTLKKVWRENYSY